MVFCLSLFLVLSPSFISRLIFIVISHSFSIWLLPDSFLFSRSIYTHVFVSLIGVHKMWCEWMVGVGVSTHESGAAIRPRDPYHTVNSYGSCVCVCMFVYDLIFASRLRRQSDVQAHIRTNNGRMPTWFDKVIKCIAHWFKTICSVCVCLCRFQIHLCICLLFMYYLLHAEQIPVKNVESMMRMRHTMWYVCMSVCCDLTHVSVCVCAYVCI